MAETVPVPRPRPPDGFGSKKPPAPPPGFVMEERRAAPPPPPAGFVLQAPGKRKTAPKPIEEGGSFLPEIGKGVAGGAVSTTGTMLKGLAGKNAATLESRRAMFRQRLDIMDKVDRGEEVTPDIGYNTELGIADAYKQMSAEDRKKFRAQTESDLAKAVDPGDVADQPLYKAGQAVQDFSSETFKAAKDYEDSWTRAISEGFGSTLPFIGAGLAGPGGVAAGTMAGSAASAGEAVDKAIQAGATREQILAAVRLGGVPGLTEQLPIEVLFERVPFPQWGKFTNALVKVLSTAAAEGGQEGVQQIAQNLIERYVYNPDQEITKDVLSSATIGAIVGGGVKVGEQAVDKLAGGSKEAKAAPAKAPQPATVAEPAQAAPPAPPAGFEVQPTAAAPTPVPGETPAVGPESAVAASPRPTAASPAATPEQRSVLQKMKWTDADIDTMSAEEVAAEVERGQRAGIAPSAPPSAAAGAAVSSPLAAAPVSPVSPEMQAAANDEVAMDAAVAESLKQPLPQPEAKAPDIGDILRRRTLAAKAVNAAVQAKDDAALAAARPQFLSVMRELEQADPEQFAHYANLPGNKRLFPELTQAVEAQQDIQPANPSAPTVPEPTPINVRPRKQGVRKTPLDIVEYLAAQGGIYDYKGELRGLDLSKRFVPGYGRLIRKRGMPLDRARENAAQEGYFNHLYGDPATASARSTVADLLNLLEQNERGQRAYTTEGQYQADEIAAAETSRPAEIDQELADSALEELKAIGIKPDDPLTQRALEIMLQQEIDPVDAVEQAAMQMEGDDGVQTDVDDVPFFEASDDEVQPGTSPEGGAGFRAPGERGEAAKPEGEAEGGRAPAPSGGEGGTAVSAKPDQSRPVESQPVSGQGEVDEFDAAFDAALDDNFPTPPPGFIRDEESPYLQPKPGGLTQDQVNDVLRSKEWKKVFGSTTNINADTNHYAHRESQVAWDMARGWLDAKAGKQPREPHKFTAVGGGDPREGYLEAYIGAKYGDAFEIRLSDAHGVWQSIVNGTFDKPGPSEQPAAEPGAEGKPQTLLPGVAPVTDKDKAQVKAEKPLTAKKPQKEPGGLFGDDKDQTDINDFLQPPKKPAEDLRGKVGEKQGKWTRIGWNATGNPVWEDDYGVRSYTQAGVRITEKVGFHPTGGIIKPTSHDAEFMPVGTAGEAATSAVKNTAEGFDAAVKGIMELFGGKGAKLSSGFTFDEETYQKAKPHFQVAVQKFAAAGRDIAEMVKHLVRYLAQNGMDREAIDRMRPYVRRFVEDETKAAAPESAKPAPTPKAGELSLVEELRDRLLDPAGGFRTIVEARKFLTDNGWKPNSEEIAKKEAEEFIEHAVVLAARDIVQASKKRGPETTFERLVGLYNRQPRLSSRTSQSMAEQAYSTPVPLAYAASRLAGITSETSVLEPTAGNGMLLIDASPSKAQVNEINDARAAALMQQGFRVSTRDATEPGLRHAGYPVDVVIANPPFGAVREGGESKVFDIDGHRTTAVDHAIALNALKHMKDNGRAVLIVGSVKAESEKERSDGFNSSQKRKFYKRLFDNYNVVQMFTVSGDLYQKQGAGWPVDVIVIDGRGKSALSLPAVNVPPLVKTWEELKGYVHERGEQLHGSGGTEVPQPAPEQPGSTIGDQPSSEPARPGKPAGEPARPEREPETSSTDDDRGQPEPAGELAGDQIEQLLGGGGEPAGADNRPAAQPRQPRVATPANATGQVPYRPYSRKGQSLNTLVPHALGASMDSALASIEERHGDIDTYVARELGYPTDDEGMYFINDKGEKERPFSAEQIDAIAMAIDNVAKGDAFIIGDQTGIGKGRVVAAAIRFAHKKGMQPVFVTEKPDLYGDMYRDIADIGWAKSLGREPEIFMTNAGTVVPLDDEAVDWISDRDEARAHGQPEPPRRGKFSASQTTKVAEKRMQDILSGDYKPDVIFTSYDQQNSVQGAETSRRRFMDRIAPRAFVIMDESHNAGGQGDVEKQRLKKGAPPPRSQKFREWVQAARAVMYSSATYAKNPNVMDLYSRTDMAKAVSAPKELPDLITKGKVPLQQVVASMLADSGQYARRERSFEGVEYALEVVPVNQENYAGFSKAIKRIYRFDRLISDFRKEWIEKWLKENGAGLGMDSGLGDIAANSTEFASIMHNVVNQMLLAIKAEGAAQRALKAIADGEKPVVALSKTAESFITDYAEDAGINIGDAINIDFRDVLRRYLDRTLRITVRMPDETKMHVYIPVEDLGRFEDDFHRARETIDGLDLGDMPVSPIDHIRRRITEAGHSIREITGRQTMMQYGDKDTLLVVRPREEQKAAGKRVTIKMFNSGKIDAALLNRSGSTGVSMHASSKFTDRRRRRMILAEADPNIDTHMQMLGRVHRTGQVIPPAYTQLAADIPAEARPTAVLMKKMASLNANTTAARKSAFTAEAVDFMNEYGDKAAVVWARDNPLTNVMLGSPIKFDENGKPTGDGQIQKLTGRIMLLEPAEQQELLDVLTASYNSILAQMEAMGENALEAKVLDLQAEPVAKAEIRPGTGPSPFEGSAQLETMRVKSPGRAMRPVDVLQRVAGELSQPIRSPQAPFAYNMDQLQPSGANKAQALRNRIGEEVKTFRQQVINGIKDPQSRASADQKLTEQQERFNVLTRLGYVGNLVTIAVPGEEGRTTPAIVIEVSQSKRETKNIPNPVAPSSWMMTLAIPDMSRQITIPFSQLSTAAEEKNAVAGLVIRQREWTDNFASVEKLFEAAAKEGKEERFIATGNLLAAFEQLQGKGQIIQFTDAEGNVKPGIIMPRTYTLEQFAKERRVKFGTHQQAMEFLTRSENGILTDTKDVITVAREGDGRFSFSIDARKTKGGRYVTDDLVRAVYDKWTKQGATMDATVDKATAARLIEAISAVGAKFVAPGEFGLANEIIHGKAKPQAPKATPKAEYQANPEGWGAVEGGYSQPLLRPEEMRELADVVRRVAGEIDPVFSNTITVPAGHAGLQAWGNGDTASTAAGAYIPSRDILLLALDTATRGTAYHEAFHRLQNLFLKPEERRVLAAETERLRQIVATNEFNADRVHLMSQKEIEAEAFAVWSVQMDLNNAAGLRLHIALRRAWGRIRQILRRVKNWLAGNGYRTAEDVFGPAYRGEIAQRQARPLPGPESQQYQPAWHGTPHKFDRFSTEHIGTGEGNQAFGWGLYFAGKRQIAEHYRKALSNPEPLSQSDIDTLRQDGQWPDDVPRYIVDQDEPTSVTWEDIAREIDSYGGDGKAYVKDVNERYSFETPLKPGRLYQVEVPEDHELMDWEQPLPAKHPARDILWDAAKPLVDSVYGDLRSAGTEARNVATSPYTTGAQLYGRLSSVKAATSAKNVFNPRERSSIGDRMASEALHAAGIPGHRYLDNTSRGIGITRTSTGWSVMGPGMHSSYMDTPAGEKAAREEYERLLKKHPQTYNYVIYDDARIAVTAMFQLAQPLALVPTRERPAAIATTRINRVLTATVAKLKAIDPKDRRHRADEESAGAYWVRKWEDYLDPLLRMQKEHGHNLNELNDAYLNARLMEDAALADIAGMHDKFIGPMTDELAAVGASLEELHRFMYAMHAQERNEVVGARNPWNSDLYKAVTDTSLVGASGMSTDQANEILRTFRADTVKFRGLKQAAGHVRAMLDEQLLQMRRAGLISDDTYAALTTQWRNYVPLKGLDGMDEEGFYRPGLSGFDVRGDEYKAALGRYSEAENVIAHAIHQSEQGILRQHKNDVDKAALRFINEFDPTGENVAEVFWAGTDGLGDIQKADQVFKRKLGADGRVQFVRVPNPFSNRDDVLAAKVGGKTYWIKFKDPKIGLALRKLSKAELGLILKIIRPITVWQSIVNTRANPAFTPINIIRDVQVGAVHLLDEGFTVAQVAGIVKNIPKAWGALWRQQRGTAKDTDWDRAAKEYFDAGGKITFHGYASLEQTLHQLEKEVNRKVTGEPGWRQFLKVWRMIRQLIAHVNDTGENGIRLAAYMAARKEQGRTAKESAFMARDLTVDFKKHGEFGQTMNTLYVFFNAAYQGNANVVRRLARSRKVRAAVAGFVFAGMMQHIWNSLMAGDDDDGENAYQRMLKNEPWKLERQFVFFIPGTNRYVSFPMPYGYNAFHHFGVQGGAIMTGDVDPTQGLLNTLRVYFDAFNPIGSGSIANMLSPTLTDPAIELWGNENVFGAPIYPSASPFDRSPPPRSEQAFSTTHPLAIWLAQTANRWFGGDEIVPGAVDIYPDAIEHLWGFATGGLGRFISQGVQTAEGAVRGEIEPAKIPIWRNFYGEIDEQSQKTQYYKLREQVLAAEGYRRSYLQTGNAARLKEYEQDHPTELRAVPAFKGAEKIRRALNKERRRIENADMSSAERKKRLDDIAAQELKAMREARKAYIAAAKRGRGE